MNGLIQGDNAVLSFFKDDWAVYVCASQIDISLSADVLAIRTPGAGHWGKNTYQKLNYTISISGVVVYNQPTDTNFTSMDMISNALGFTNVKFRIAYTDDQGDIKSVQGYGVVSGITWSAITGNVVKDDVSIVGDGELLFFDGLIPCDSTIETITVTGQTASDGIVHVIYTYIGAPYRVKWRIDGTGTYNYTILGTTIDIPGLALGAHSIEIIPVCLNGYESENSASQAFVVTQALVCSAIITDITITSSSATPVYTGAPSQYQVSVDGGPFTTLAIFVGFGIGGLSIGSHTITMIPMCSNNVLGTGFTKPFTVSSNPAQSVINWNLSQDPDPSNYLQIYANGLLVLNQTVSGSGSFVVMTGQTVKGILNSSVAAGGRDLTLTTTDQTTSLIINNQTAFSPVTLQYSFTANGDTFLIQGVISP